MCYNHTSKSKERDSLSDFGAVFESLIREAIRNQQPAKQIVPERLKVLGEIYNDLSELTGTQAELKLRPKFASGDVTIRLPQMHIEGEQVQKLKEVLERCNTFEILPLRDGSIEASVTIDGVFDRNE